MAETPKSLVENVVNPSGFPFQLRIEHEIEMTSDEHRWRVVAREYHWIDKATRADGYIDIVLEHERARAVVECKRVKEDSIWVFLIPTPSPGMISRSRLLWASSIRSIGGLIGWDDLHIRPDSYQSAFCVVRGQSDKSTPMLERMSADVLLSLEGLATEELSLFQEQDQDRDKLYVPLIVTNAGLEVYHFDPKDIGHKLSILGLCQVAQFAAIGGHRLLDSQVPVVGIAATTLCSTRNSSSDVVGKGNIRIVQLQIGP